MGFNLQKFVDKMNSKLLYKEQEYCKDTGRTFSHVQQYNFDGLICKLEHTHKIFIANNAEIRSYDSFTTIKEII